jgi:hypothetical protein
VAGGAGGVGGRGGEGSWIVEGHGRSFSRAKGATFF